MKETKRNFKQFFLGMVCTMLLVLLFVGNVFAAQTEPNEEGENFTTEQQAVLQETEETVEPQEKVAEKSLWDIIWNPIGSDSTNVEEMEETHNSSEEEQPMAESQAFTIYATKNQEELYQEYLDLMAKGPAYVQQAQELKQKLLEEGIWQETVEEIEEKGVIPIATSCNAPLPIATACNATREEEVIEQVPKEEVLEQPEELPIEDESIAQIEEVQAISKDEEMPNESEVLGIDQEKLIPLGTFRTTAYCPCRRCNGKWTTTATGVDFQEDHTIAVDPKVIPLNSRLVINGIEYKAEDTGGAIKGKRIDIFHGTHQEALCYGVQYVEVYRIAA